MARRSDPRPLSERVAAELRAKIMTGELKPGSQLPSTAQLVTEYQAANTTIQKALSALKDEGFVMAHRGKGVYVRDRQPFIVQVSPFFAPSPGGFSYDLLEVATVHPPADVAEALQLPSDGLVVLRRRVMSHDGEPVELDHSYYPLELIQGTELAGKRKIRGGSPRVLAELGYPQREFTDQVSARMPTTEEVEALDLPEVPVIRQFRTVYSDDEKPVEVNVMIKGGHRYELKYRQPAS